MAFSASFLYRVIDKMSPAMKKFKKDNQDLQKQLKANQAQVNIFSNRMVAMGKTGQRAMAQITTEGKNTAQMLDMVKRKARETKKEIGKTLKFAGGKLKAGAGSTRTGSLVATSGIIGMTLAFSKFEKGTENVFTLMNSGQVEKYRKSIIDLEKSAISEGFSIADVTKAMFDNVSGLGAGEEALSGYRSALILAKAGNTDLTSATKGIISIMNVYELAASEATAVSSALFTAQKIGVTTVEEMSGAIGRLAPTAKAAGLSYMEVATSLAVMTKGGLSTEEAATAMRATINALINPSKEAAKAMHHLGVPMGITAVKAAGIGKTLLALKNAMKEDEDVIVQLIPNIRALTGVLSLSEKKLKLMDDAVKQANKDTKNATELNAAYSRMMNILAADIGKAKGSITLLAIELGGKLKPIVTKVMNAIIFLADEFLKAPDWLQNATLGLLLFTMALSPLLGASGMFLMGAANLVTFATWIKTTAIGMKAITAVQWLWNIALSANPVGAVVWAIIGLIAVISGLTYWMWTSYDSINAWFDQFGLVGKIVKFVALGPLFWLVTAIKEATAWMQKLGWISDDTVKKTNKFADMQKELQLGGDTALKLQEQRNLTIDKFKADQAPGQRIRADLNVNLRDPGNQVESVKSKLFGLDNAGVTVAGAGA